MGMGIVHTVITLKNVKDIIKAEEGLIKENEIRQATVDAMVEIHWKDRTMACQPLVVSGNGEILLGAIPLEDMDLMVDPVRQILTGAHGDEIVSMMK